MCHVWIHIVKDNNSWVLVLKDSARRRFLALDPYGKISAPLRE
jgi:hypothetical protein